MISLTHKNHKPILPIPIRRKTKKQILLVLDQINRFRHYIWEKNLKETPILKKPIFIIGCPRSGTSIFVKLCATDPWVANWSEAGRVWDNVNYFNKDAEHCWEPNIVTKKNANRLHSKFEWFRQIHKKKRFINKHPRNSVRIKYIRKIFPDAYFIHVIRDGRAVVNSIVNKINNEPIRQKIPFGNFCKPPNWRKYLCDDIIKQTAMQWKEIVQYILSNRDDLGDKYFEVKYEDFCSKPHDTFRDIYKFVGLPLSSEFLNSFPKSLEAMNYKYKENFSLEQINTITATQKDLLQKLGYEI